VSRFKVKKELVIEAANNALAKNDAVRAKHFEDDVQKHMKRANILCFFGMKPVPRDQAEAYVTKYSDITASWRIMGWGTRGQAKDLLAACAVTESGLVELDTDDAAFVRKWVSL